MGKHRTSKAKYRTFNEEAGEVWEFNDGGTNNRKFDLENRLLEFASAVRDLTEKLPTSRAGNHVAAQLLRSGTSPYPNHREAESAESRDDFIYKLKICLKEMRETLRWTRLIRHKGWAKGNSTLIFVLGESEELIRIFFASIQTARRNNLSEKRRPATTVPYPTGKAG